MGNRKVINATPTTLGDIAFKSKLESKLFEVLQDKGFNPRYEPFKFHIWEGFKPTIPFYIKDKKTRSLKLEKTKLIDITYSPDIVFTYGNYLVLIEVKPDYFNDVYPYKRKLFRKFLEGGFIDSDNKNYKPIYAQIGTKRNLLEFIKILEEEYNEESERNISPNN